MTDTPAPWVGLAAVIAMFVIPFLPDWLFEGPRTIKHWPRRHVCGKCGAPWTGGHCCVHDAGLAARPPLRGELRRRSQSHNRPRLVTLKDHRRSKA
jgi:hypothetical protein